jgi:hypothetical protein
MQKGDPDAAIAWLRSIPLRFLPPSVAKEPVFASIQDRAEFQAIFQPREPLASEPRDMASSISE